MASADELAEAYADWRRRSNDNERLKKMVRGWDRVIHFALVDDVEGLPGFTMEVRDQQLSVLSPGHVGTPDVVVTGSSEDFCDMFWGDLNPIQKYLRGEIAVKGSQEDVMRLDAICYVIWPDV